MESSEYKAHEAIRQMVLQRTQERVEAENREKKQQVQQETRERNKSEATGAPTPSNVTINIPGRPRRTLQVASQQDALTLTGVLRDLENAQGVAA